MRAIPISLEPLVVDAHVSTRVSSGPHRQYENSSDRTSWDWIEQKRGVFSSSPELEDFVDSWWTTDRYPGA